MTRSPFDTVIERDGEEIEVRVIYDVSPIIAATGPTYDCGGQPEEGGEIELISVKRDGQPFELTEAESQALFNECVERSFEDMADEAAAAMEWRADQRRDDQMMERWERGE